MDLRHQSTDLLFELARQLLQLDDPDAMLDTLVRESLMILGAERGFLVLRRYDSRAEGSYALDYKVVRNWNRAQLEGVGEPVSQSIVAHVMAEGEPVLIEDALADGRFAKAESVLRMGLRSVLAAPLRVEGETVGALYLEASRPERLFESCHFEIFQRILGLASRALEVSTRQLVLAQRNRTLEKEFLARYDFRGIITRDPGFLRLLKTVGQVATSQLPVLVQGPSGTGKELIVRALYLNSRRSRRRLVTVNCGAITPSLLESELFGHVRGAFTGADRDKVGTIAAADGGTLFLDEIGELSVELQTKLLRVLQFGEVQPVGSSRPIKVDVRFLAATNRDLVQEVEAGSFREDLLYRLNAITLDLPPLKQRTGDILPLFTHFLAAAAKRDGRPVPAVTPRLERALQGHDWPGNVRELENEAGRLVAITPEGLPLTAESLSPRISKALVQKASGGLAPVPLAEQERELIELHLRLVGGNRTHAAKSLGISREGLRQKMLRYGLS
ncbi:MAG: sigma-54-dependent Fis family transcriptional regulator [Acidobacteriota bacterium]